MAYVPVGDLFEGRMISDVEVQTMLSAGGRTSTISNLPRSKAVDMMPFAPPILADDISLAEAVEEHVPGEIKVSKSGKMYLRYLSYSGLADDEIVAFDNFMFNRIPEIINSQQIIFDNKHVLRVRKVISLPPMKSDGNTKVLMYPIEAQNTDSNYVSTLHLEIERVNVETGEAVESLRHYFGQIPVMLGSQLDNLTQTPDGDRGILDKGGCVNDPGGTFILGGGWLVVKRKTLRYNRIITMPESKPKRKGTPVCRMTCSTLKGTTLVKLFRSDDQAIMVNLRLNYQNEEKALNIMQVFRLLYYAKSVAWYKDQNRYVGIHPDNSLYKKYYDPEVVLDDLKHYTRPEWLSRIRVAFTATLAVYNVSDNIIDDAKHIKNIKKQDDVLTDDKIRENAIEAILEDVFPQIQVDDSATGKPAVDIQHKIDLLMHMLAQYLETIIGVRKIDNRDMWDVNKIDNSASMMEELFINLWDWFVYKVNEGLANLPTGTHYTLNKVSKYFHDGARMVTKSYESSFKTTRWQVIPNDSLKISKNKGQRSHKKLPKPKDKISDTLKREGSHVQTNAQILRVRVPANPRSATRARFMNNSQHGYIGPSETPEGKFCGLVLTKTPTCWISIHRPDELYTLALGEYDENGQYLYYYSPQFIKDFYETRFIWNGRFMGWMQGDIMYARLKTMKRFGQIPFDTCIIYTAQDKVLYLYSDSNRPTRPLLVVNEETGRLIIDEKDLWGKSFNHLFNAGAVEYIDSWEQSSVYIAMYPSSVQALINDEAMALAEMNQMETQLANIKNEFETTRDGKFTNSFIMSHRKAAAELEKRQDNRNKDIAQKQVKIDEEVLEIKNLEETLSQRQEELEKEIKKNAFSIKTSLEKQLELTQDQVSDDTKKIESQIAQEKAKSDNLEKNLETETNLLKRQTLIDTSNNLQKNILTLKVKAKQKRKLLNPSEWDNYQSKLRNKLENVTTKLNDKIINAKQRLANDIVLRKKQVEKEQTMLSRRSKIISLTADAIDIVTTDTAASITVLQMAEDAYTNARNNFNRISSIPKYTHSEMDPNALLGQSVSIVPLPDKNPAPRNTYQCAMGKQALAIPFGNYHMTFPTSLKTLASPARPLFEPQINAAIGLNNLPAGENVIMAIMTYGGWTIEDAVILNKRSVDAGLFKIVVYNSYTTTIQAGGQNVREVVQIPDRKKKKPGAYNIYHALGPKGIARKGAKVKEGDVIIGKIRIVDGETKEVSKRVGLGESGIVDEIYKSLNAKGETIIKVRIRRTKKPEVGDKLASRHANKSTISRILPPEQMPKTKKGVTPDLILNPHAIPTRMTIGKLVELISSKLAALSGERLNASAFNNFDINRIRSIKDELLKYGFNGGGLEEMINGITGERMTAQIFIGPMYYQRLRHLVGEKVQARARGPINPLTREPVRGRKRMGGLRLGEMERDALISHGLSEVLNERYCMASNPFEVPVCVKCGRIAVADLDRNRFSCDTCKNNSFGKVTIPYSWKLITHVMLAAGIDITMSYTDEVGEDIMTQYTADDQFLEEEQKKDIDDNFDQFINDTDEYNAYFSDEGGIGYDEV